MRLRLLAFFPVTILMTSFLLVSASSIVSAIEASLSVAETNAIGVRFYETGCDVLRREIRAIERDATACDRDLRCLESPILCPITMNEDEASEYRVLRERFDESCRGEGEASWEIQKRFAMEISYCHSENAVGESSVPSDPVEPATFVF